jgi:hypothetical protein
MNINNFLDKENLNTLWDVISDEEIFKFLTRDIQSKIASLFLSNVKGFFEIERTKNNNLVDLNKKYILLILNYIKQTYPYRPNKIKIYDELPTKENITAEEIQNERKSQFERDLYEKQQDFENSINVKVPPVPEFADKYEDTPISEMDKIIREMTAKRNYDVEQINRNNNSDLNQTTSWLKAQETSLKTEKFTPKKNQEEPIQNYSRFKFLNNIDEYNNSVETNKIISQKKNVTWGENNEISNSENDEETQSIFNKLKKINKKEESSENIQLSFNESTSEERISNLENEIKSINNKIDIIINLLKENK